MPMSQHVYMTDASGTHTAGIPPFTQNTPRSEAGIPDGGRAWTPCEAVVNRLPLRLGWARGPRNPGRRAAWAWSRSFKRLGAGEREVGLLEGSGGTRVFLFF